MSIVKLNPKQVEAVNKLIEYTIDEERDHLEETLYDKLEVEGAELTDEDLFDEYKDNPEVNDHIWFSIYELQKIVNKK